MVTLLIIEDEALERETMTQILKEAIPDIQLYAAKNGLEALAMYDRYQPSIVLADINIPMMNGLEVIREIKQKGGDCAFLIVSSYNYFQYAQEAIRLGVEDFLLKPYNLEQFIQSVRLAISRQYEKKDEEQKKSALMNKLERVTPVMESECFYSILANKDEIKTRQIIRLLDEQIRYGFCIIFHDKEMYRVFKDHCSVRDARYLCEGLHDNYICFVLLKQEVDETDKQRFEKAFTACNRNHELQVGSIQQDIHIYHSYIDAKRNTMPVFAKNSASTPPEQITTLEIFEQVEKAFEDLDEEKVKQILHTYTVLLLSKNKETIEEEVQSFLELLYKHVNEHYPQAIAELAAPIKITNILHQEIDYYINSNVMKYYQAMVDERFKNTNQLVRQALKYIDNNYKRPITLHDLSEALHVSPFYISKLLNSTMKKTFTELVSEKRVEVSKELLRSNKRIKEIAYEVGFQGQNYFTKIFKKYTGITPKVYKNTFEE